MSRMLSLTPDISQTIVHKLRAGARVKDALAATGVAASTYHRWYGLGAPGGTDPASDIYREFRRAVDDARAHALVEATARDWRIAAVRLERMYPERWARRGRR